MGGRDDAIPEVRRPDEWLRLSRWAPVVARVLPADRRPATALIRTPPGCSLWALLDGEVPEGFDVFLAAIAEAEAAIGPGPYFWRADTTSAKHGWLGTCWCPAPGDFAGRLGGFVEAVAEQSVVDVFPVDVWACREPVPVEDPVCTAFEGLPIGRERRYIVRDGLVVDHFPYWPLAALTGSARAIPDGMELSDGELVRAVGRVSREWSDEHDRLAAMARSVGAALAEASGIAGWSVDFLKADRGWLCIDAAPEAVSWRPTDRDRADWARCVVEAETWG